MAEKFTAAEWAAINAALDADPDRFGLPRRRDDSVVLMSWNIRKFGALSGPDGLKKTEGAFDMIEKVCARADLIAIQEVQSDTESLLVLRDRLSAGGAPWEVLFSDVTGLNPGYKGMAERKAFLYRSDRVRRGELASDLSFERSAVVENMNAALSEVVARTVAEAGDAGLLAQVQAWLAGQRKIAGAKLKKFVQFIRTPHIAEFIIEGPAGAYEFYCVNAHLVSGQSKAERELEFFALMEWLLHDSASTVEKQGKSFLLMADLNLDFEADVSRRRTAFAAYITAKNQETSMKTRVNFPFLDGGFFTNARQDETFDHIAWFTTDTRLPRGRHNGQAGTLGADEYDYGMFNFATLFSEAGPGQGTDGNPAYDRYTHDFTDHMPIWVRLPRPHAGQTDFTVPENG